MEYNVENNVFTVKTDKGDCFSRTFSPRSVNVNSITLKSIWEFIKNDYQLISLDDSIQYIYITPNIFWTIYKKIPYGRQVLTSPTVWKDQAGRVFNFAPTNFYFNKKAQLALLGVTSEGDYGIYGIYKVNTDELIYIGQTQRDFELRWAEHKDRLNGIGNTDHMKLYSLGLTSEDVYFKPIVTNRSISDAFGIEEFNPIYWQLIEYSFIQFFKPIGNSENYIPKYKDITVQCETQLEITHPLVRLYNILYNWLDIEGTHPRYFKEDLAKIVKQKETKEYKEYAVKHLPSAEEWLKENRPEVAEELIKAIKDEAE